MTDQATSRLRQESVTRFLRLLLALLCPLLTLQSYPFVVALHVSIDRGFKDPTQDGEYESDETVSDHETYQHDLSPPWPLSI